MNDEALDALYQDILLDHYRNPRCAGELLHTDCSHEGYNPLCGDAVTVQIQSDENATQISQIRFEGKGCSISRASSSIMCSSVEGKSFAYSRNLIAAVEAMILKHEKLSESLPEDLNALQGIQKFPARYRCALLAWQSLRHCLDLMDGQKK